MHLEENVPDLGWCRGLDDSDDARENYTIWAINRDRNLKPYTYDEAINMAGHGLYSVGLLLVNCLALFGMCLDMFAFSVIVNESACELQFEGNENYILLSVPFIGAILSAYIWGYISDTKGRRISLLIAMWGSFVASSLCALSHSWIVLAVLKLISVGFCSSAQSITYTLIGESCPNRIKDLYFLIITCVLILGFPCYVTLGYISLNWNFTFDLYFISFTPWRLLTIIFALPLGISAIGLHFFYESPKFLVNNGNEKLALEILSKIWMRNRCIGKQYPVQKLILNEEGNINTKNQSLLKSMWEQTVPLFKMPRLLRTLQLYYLIFVLYITNNTVYVWFPFMANEFISGISSIKNVQGLCDIISHSQPLNSTVDSCVPKSDTTLVWGAVGQGLLGIVITFIASKIASRRKVIIMTLFAISSVCSIGCAAINFIYASIVMFFIVPITLCCTGSLFSYFVYLYPTSYRGMASCLGVLVARLTGLLCVNVVGRFIMTYCSETFYFVGINLICGMIVAYFLPSDNI